jgi:hypothetical protein
MVNYFLFTLISQVFVLLTSMKLTTVSLCTYFTPISAGFKLAIKLLYTSSHVHFLQRRKKYSETCLNPTLIKPKTYINPTLIKPKTCLNPTLIKPKTCINPTLIKPKTCLNPTLIKPKTCLNPTLIKPKNLPKPNSD